MSGRLLAVALPAAIAIGCVFGGIAKPEDSASGSPPGESALPSQQLAAPLALFQSQGAWHLSGGRAAHAEVYVGRASLAPQIIEATAEVEGEIEKANLRIVLASSTPRTANVRASLYVNDRFVGMSEEMVPLLPSIRDVPDNPVIGGMRWRSAEFEFPLERPVDARNVHVVIELDLPPGLEYYVLTDGASGMRFDGGAQ